MDKKMHSDAGKQKKATPAAKPAAGMQAKGASSMSAGTKPARMNKSELIGK